MTEEPKEKQEYEFIKEQIVPKRKNKIMKRVWTAVFVVCMAVVFGLVAEIVMLTSEDVLREWLGIEEGERQEVNLNRPSPTEEATKTPDLSSTNKPTPEPSPTEVPAPTEEPEETKAPTEAPLLTTGATATGIPEATTGPQETTKPEDTLTPEPMVSGAAELTPTPTETGIPKVTDVPGETGIPQATMTPGVTNVPEGTGTPVPSQGAEPTKAPTITSTPTPTPDLLYNYLQVHQRIIDIAEEVANSLVVVEAVEEGVDWFQEVFVTRTRTTGLVLANDGVDLLILVDLERISGATYIDVYFEEEVVSGRVYSLDKDYGLAVVAVPLSSISTETLKRVQIGILAAEEDIKVGALVIALGAPNGYEGSMEVGMITSMGSTVPVTDGVVSYFTTNISDYEGGYGFVVNLDGEFLGMITHTKKENTADGVFSVIGLDEIRNVIVKLLNNSERAYFGIKGQDLPRSVKLSSGLETGVYVSEVANSSPALNAGIKAGDIIVMFGNEPVSGIRELNEKLLQRSAREIVMIKLMRRAEDGLREITIEVPLAVRN